MLQGSSAPVERSQKASYMIVLLGPVRKARVDLRKPVVRLCQTCWVDPVVCEGGLVDFGIAKWLPKDVGEWWYLIPHDCRAVEKYGRVVGPASGHQLPDRMTGMTWPFTMCRD